MAIGKLKLLWPNSSGKEQVIPHNEAILAGLG